MKIEYRDKTEILDVIQLHSAQSTEHVKEVMARFTVRTFPAGILPAHQRQLLVQLKQSL